MRTSNATSLIGPMRRRSRLPARTSSYATANGIAGSSAHPSATLAPSGMWRRTASASETTFEVTPASTSGPRTARPLLPLVSRLALLAESDDALLRVVRREETAHGRVLEDEAVRERHPEALDRRELDLPDREARPGGVRGRALLRPGDELGRGHDLVDDAQRLRLGGLDRLAAEHEVERLLPADEPRETLRAAGPRQETEGHLGKTDAVRPFGGHSDVAAQSDLQAAAEAVPVHRDDDDLRRPLELRDDLVGVDDEHELLLRVGRREPLHVRAGAEEALRAAADDDRLHAHVEARLVDGRRQVRHEASVVRVRRRAIEDDVTDRVLLLEPNYRHRNTLPCKLAGM